MAIMNICDIVQPSFGSATLNFSEPHWADPGPGEGPDTLQFADWLTELSLPVFSNTA